MPSELDGIRNVSSKAILQVSDFVLTCLSPRCSLCAEALEHVSSYEHEGRPFCHLDYHEVCFDPESSVYRETLINLLAIRATMLPLRNIHHRRAFYHSRRPSSGEKNVP